MSPITLDLQTCACLGGGMVVVGSLYLHHFSNKQTYKTSLFWYIIQELYGAVFYIERLVLLLGPNYTSQYRQHAALRHSVRYRSTPFIINIGVYQTWTGMSLVLVIRIWHTTLQITKIFVPENYSILNSLATYVLLRTVSLVVYWVDKVFPSDDLWFGWDSDKNCTFLYFCI